MDAADRTAEDAKSIAYPGQEGWARLTHDDGSKRRLWRKKIRFPAALTSEHSPGKQKPHYSTYWRDSALSVTSGLLITMTAVLMGSGEIPSHQALLALARDQGPAQSRTDRVAGLRQGVFANRRTVSNLP